MKAVWLQGGGRRRVLIVFAGWGMDAARPDRDLQGAVAELQFLRRLPAPRASVFREALVSGTDRVILPGNQQCCWDRYAVPTRPVQGPHYPFHLWTHWEEVLACARS